MARAHTNRFVLFAALGAFLVCAAYVAEQQVLRREANDPQLLMAQELAASLADAPAGPSTLSPSVDIGASSAPYLVVYDAYGTPVTGTGTLGGALPTLPAGVFDVVRGKGQDRITWQPEAGVREAVVVVPVAGGAGGFVMGGRSLARTEAAERRLGFLSLAAAAAILLVSFLGAYFARRGNKRAI